MAVISPELGAAVRWTGPFPVGRLGALVAQIADRVSGSRPAAECGGHGRAEDGVGGGRVEGAGQSPFVATQHWTLATGSRVAVYHYPPIPGSTRH
ncbi:MAG: hypothetical protein ACRDU4_10330, partial [Mycobacterium sp.]